MGRDTYHGMAPYWATATDAYAAPMNDKLKVAFSKALANADRYGQANPLAG